MRVDSNKIFNYNGAQIKYLNKRKNGKEFIYNFIDMSKEILDDDAMITLTEKEVKALC